MDEFVCECGKSFTDKGGLKSHQNWCDDVNREPPKISYKKVECPECGDKVAETQLEKHKNSKTCKLGGKFETILKSNDKSYKSNSSNNSNSFNGINSSSNNSNNLDKHEKVGDNKYKCYECGKVYSKKGIGSHYWRRHTEEGRSHNPNEGYDKGQREAWNKGLTKENSEGVRKMAETLTKKYESGEYVSAMKGKTHSKETREKLSVIRSKNNPGGWCDWHSYEKNNGEKVKLQGKWEVKCAEILDDKNIKWIKPTSGEHFLEYEDDEGIVRKYVPDFYLPNKVEYLEVKGHWWADSKQKMKLVKEQNKQIDIKIIKADKIDEFEQKTKKIILK